VIPPLFFIFRFLFLFYFPSISTILFSRLERQDDQLAKRLAGALK
jgi:hypothetical protein